MQETTGFFKKKMDKMQKGLGKTFMTGQKKNSQEQISDTSATEQTFRQCLQPPAGQDPISLNPKWVSALAQMGFQETQVLEAATILGGQPEQLDDLLQVLSAMNASSPPSPVFKTEPEVQHHQETTTTPTNVNAPTTTNVQAPPPPMQTTTTMRETPVAEPEPVMLPLPARACASAELEEASERYRMSQQARQQGSGEPALSPSAMISLQKMGFATDTIQQASATLGSRASYEELFDMLLAMGSPLSPPNTGGAASSTDVDSCCAAARRPEDEDEEEEEAALGRLAAAAAGELITESLHQVADATEQPVKIEIVQEKFAEVPDKSTQLQDVSNRALAQAIVASVLAKAASKEPSCQPKKIGNASTLSPVKGGA